MAEDKKAGDGVINCAGCKKLVKRAKRYFRDGKHYCNFNCWRKVKPSAAAQPAEAEQQS